VYYGEGDARNVSESFAGKQTNNIAEVRAVLSAYHQIRQEDDVHTTYVIYTDSMYTLGYATRSGDAHQTTNWSKHIPNKELVKQLYQSISSHPNIQIRHIKAHTQHQDVHSLGNEQADKLANQAIGCTRCPYDVSHRVYLKVPYAHRKEAKEKGCKWDKHKKGWWCAKDNPELGCLVACFAKG
jgi:ribonuclease HI